ncbi:MAG: M48 family metalloprotease [Gemmatimonadetes bacterium]|nr:M48 family metalloprotease [Gemmatimonadota bacterium]MYA64772.1 M48 family metalloprotease [Gemmatimonadota bacterium]MYB99592.1 M48 family metalloprotease [Gemmatimonadota bacterium]MYH52908.1 M48 family metalloprotease [Gemmatimonadota bacterium]MYI44890.1 M48 family metalloprotease [Gemmatimonadota bacterium]
MTDILLQIGATKLALAIALSGMVWLVQQRVKRPAIIHALWLMVLGAMLVPAVVPLRVLPEEGAMEVVPQAEAVPRPGIVPPRLPSREVGGEIAVPSEVGPPVVVADAGVSSDGIAPWGWLAQNRKPLAVLLWLLGSAGFFAWTVVRTVRFQRTLSRAARPAPQLQRLATQIGDALGLPRVPGVYTTDARLRPLVWWAGGRVRILIPSVFLDELDETELRAVLAHELAHVRRRDYLVRLVELLACSAYWWNPVVWWAKRGMRSAEESSCDVLAVSASRLTRDRYAGSLLRVVEIMSAAPMPRAPALASTADSCRNSRLLEKRLRTVLAIPAGSSRAGGVRVAGLAALACGLSLGFVYCAPVGRSVFAQPQLPTPAVSEDGAGNRTVVLEIDYTAGRTIIDDERRSMRTTDLAVDRSRGILYVIDAEEREGIMAFSLETGGWIRTVRTPRGYGLREFPGGRWSTAIAPDGGLYVSGPGRVLEHDALGAFVGTWSPAWQKGTRVCDFDGEPAIPMRSGVMRRGPDGTDDPIPAKAAEEDGFIARFSEDASAFNTTHVGARIACTGSTAFVVRSYLGRPDSVFAYHRSGEVGKVAVPTDFADWDGCERREVRTPSGQSVGRAPCWVWNRALTPSFDGRGNLVLLGENFDFAGTIINPGTGCYAIVRKDSSTDKARVPVRILGDSILVFHNRSESNEDGGTTYYTDSANRVSLHSLRRVSGEPCPGMFPSLDQAG